MGELVSTRRHLSHPIEAPLAHSTKGSPQQHLHPVIDGTHRRGINAYDLRFTDHAKHQVRDGAYPMHIAISNGAPLDVINLLMENAPDVLVMGDKFHRTPLHLASARYDLSLDLVQLLVNYDSTPLHECDCNNELPLHIACKNEHAPVDVIRFLVNSNPAALYLANKDGFHPVELLEFSTNEERVAMSRWMACFKMNKEMNVVA